jgi:hypothetical protein
MPRGAQRFMIFERLEMLNEIKYTRYLANVNKEDSSKLKKDLRSFVKMMRPLF